ncbi:hypothetical protein [Sphingomonas sp. ID0503]|uniref:hypothetical protein n=1 Tax=Sphingomonas sp. ID0503 TaxID=3399691 RepID=UPI003AFAC269
MSDAPADPTATQDAKPAASVPDFAAPYLEKAKAFAKDRPFASAALAGVLGIALLNTLRGKR